MTYAILINGQNAVDAGRAFCGSYCCRGIYNHGKRLAQLEVTVDDAGEYNGSPNKWVDVTITDRRNVEHVINQLARLGFSGCPCIIAVEEENGCHIKQSALCCMVI